MKLEVLQSYIKEGRAGVEKIILKHNGAFLKRHRSFKGIVEETVKYCENWFAEIRRRKEEYDEINAELYS
jgi:hypothetical protein